MTTDEDDSPTGPEQVNDHPTQPADEPLAPGRLLLQMAAGIALLMAVTFVVGRYFETELLIAGVAFVEHFGGAGIAICCGLPDAVTLPPPHEMCMAFARAGGMSFWEVISWATAGSITGGFVGYWIGRQLSHTRWFQNLIQGRARLAWQAIERHGAFALALGALSPVPYSVCCWASGAMRMRPALFLFVSLLRMPRLALYLWIIQLGLVDIGI
ncbi:MAG: VTT domain-containing protein [Myxococcota bacterium]